jgi:cell division protein FtsI (penicillin-binding protein 3)
MNRKEKKWYRFRLFTIAGFFSIFLCALVLRAFYLQIIKYESLKHYADEQQFCKILLPPERGLILDQNGQKLAATILADSVYVDPVMVKNRERTAEKIACALDMKKADVMKKLSGPGRFSWIKRKITPPEAAAIKPLVADGVFLLQEPNRFYPQRELACHILGFVNIDSQGLEGLECKYDNRLKGPPQTISWRRDAKGNRIYQADRAPVEFSDSISNIILTIDSRIQFITEQQLKDAVEANRAKGGSAIVMDPRTGEILAMANYPFFNPNAFSKVSADERRNRAITDCFDPGSVFKPFVAAAALDDGVVTEKDVFYCENGSYRVGDRVIHEAHMKRHQAMTLADIIKKSSNIGIAKVVERLTKERFYEHLTQLGFGEETGIDIPGEVPGLLRKPNTWRPVDFANMSFGQGISVTALQLATAMSAVANHGVMMKPHVVRAIVDSQGKVLEEFTPQVVRKVVSPVTAERVAALMTSVVEDEGGTGSRARITGVSIAGKTGTAQKFDFAEKAYSSQKVTASFMGFFPADEPQMVVLVIIDEPEINRWGGVAAAPTFKNISEQVLCRLDRNIEIKRVEKEAELKKVASKQAHPDAADIVQAASIEIIPSYDPADTSLIPDFTGMSLRDVLALCRERGIKTRISGSGWAVNQDPAPGMPIDDNRPCFILFGNAF